MFDRAVIGLRAKYLPWKEASCRSCCVGGLYSGNQKGKWGACLSLASRVQEYLTAEGIIWFSALPAHLCLPRIPSGFYHQEAHSTATVLPCYRLPL